VPGKEWNGVPKKKENILMGFSSPDNNFGIKVSRKDSRSRYAPEGGMGGFSRKNEEMKKKILERGRTGKQGGRKKGGGGVDVLKGCA